MLPFFLESVELPDAWTIDFLLSWWLSILVFTEAFLSIAHYLSPVQAIFNIKLKSSFRPHFATLYSGWRLGQAKGTLLLTLNQRPDNVTRIIRNSTNPV